MNRRKLIRTLFIASVATGPVLEALTRPKKVGKVIALYINGELVCYGDPMTDYSFERTIRK